MDLIFTILSSFLLSGFFFAENVNGQQANCTNLYSQKKPKSCPKGMADIYTYLSKSSGQYNRRCCYPDTEDGRNGYLYSNNCLKTSCISKETAQQGGDLCGTYLANRVFINGTEVSFEETVQDQCKGVDGNSDEIGMEVLCCPKNSMDLLLTTLYGAEHLEFPHFVRLGTGGCGATVYNKRWVLTASHCVTETDANEQRVLTKNDGDWDNCCGTVRINIDLDDAYTVNTYNVEEIIVHPNSSRLKPFDEWYRLYNDVALVKVDKDIQFNDNVKALRIPDAGFMPMDHGDYGIITGFGKSDTLTYSHKLQKANVPIRPTKEFLSYPAMSYMSDYADQLLFVGGIYKGDFQPAAGTGDSGGPFMCRDANGKSILCGITSFTGPMDACKENLDQDYCTPSAYVNVQYFTDWIKSVAGEQDEGDLLDKQLYGRNVGQNEYGNQVHITTGDGKICGGTLIAEDKVITAASCLVDDGGEARKSIRVTVGQVEIGKAPAADKVFKVTGMAILEGFEKGKGKGRRKRVISLVLESWQQGKLDESAIIKDPFYKNNLVVVKLSGKTGVKNFAKLASKKVGEGDEGREVAFPLKGMGHDGEEKRVMLKERMFKMLSHAECQKRMDRLSVIGYNVKVGDGILCGVEKYSGGSMCDRELGGGLFCKEGGKDVLCGVQVFRTCEFNVPNAFMGVVEQGDWINNAINALK